MKEQMNLFQLPPVIKRSPNAGEPVTREHVDDYINITTRIFALTVYGDILGDIFMSMDTSDHLDALNESLNEPGVQMAWIMATSWFLRSSQLHMQTNEQTQVKVERTHNILARYALDQDTIKIPGKLDVNEVSLAYSLELARILGGLYDHMKFGLEELMNDDDSWCAKKELRTADGVLWADSRAFKYVWRQINTRIVRSEQKDAFKADLDALHARRVKAHSKTKKSKQPNKRAAFFDWWIPTNIQSASINALAYPQMWLDVSTLIWHHLVLPRLEQQLKQQTAFDSPTPTQIPSIIVEGSSYSTVHKVSGALSWAFGTQDTGQVVQVDGDEYTGAPLLAQYVTRAISMQMGGQSHRVALRLNRPIKLNDGTEISPAALIDTQFVLTPYEAKTFLYLMMTAPKNDKVVQATLGELIDMLMPNNDPSHITRNCEQISSALRTLAGAQLVLPDDTVVDLFSLRRPNNPNLSRSEQTVAWCLDPNFKHLLQAEIPGNADDVLRRLNGSFLINLSAAMRFTPAQANLLRHYITACAMWNDAQVFSKGGQFKSDKVPTYSDKQWGLLTNSLGQRALDYAEGKDKGTQARKRLSEDRKKIREDLDSLQKMGLINIRWVKRSRAGYSFQLLPTPEHLKAYDKTRNPS